ncbi:MAG: putative zinc-binding metallopeptidase [Planctomycetales bacterium]|nr:putative zinc-binding metallopeptidase [Planctomycetales bacterium]
MTSPRRFGDPWLNRLTTDELLDMRLCDLPIQVAGTPLEERIEQLYGELEYRGLSFRPHFWLSDEWFTPDGVPGVAIPFYLAHPRLMRLEAKQMLEVEGGNEEWCMKIMRHEAGHAIDNAFRLRRRRAWRDMFGKASAPYPTYYNPKPYSKNFVLHLDMWYAQSHPVEDFAETFAVWLKPRSRWRSQYQGWKALKKLEFVDQLMTDLTEEKARVATRRFIDPISSLKTTLREHYRKKRSHYGMDYPNFYDRDLRRLFSDAPEHADCQTAASYLAQVRHKLRASVALWTGEYQYTIDQVLSEMIQRSRELKLRLHRSTDDTERDLLVLLTMQTMNYLHGGHHRVAL